RERDGYRQERHRGDACSKGERPEAVAQGPRNTELSGRRRHTRLCVSHREWTLAPRALWKRRTQRGRASDRMPPVLSAFRAEVEVRASASAGHRLRVGLRETPGATGSETVETPTVVLPLSIAHVAVVRVELSDQQIAPPAAHRTIRRAHERQIAGDPIVGRNRAGDRRRPIVLPSMAGRAPMRMFG